MHLLPAFRIILVEFLFFLDLSILVCYNSPDTDAMEHLYLRDGGWGVSAALARAL